MSHQKSPKVVIVDGLIGSGKSTIIRECIIPILSKKGWKITEVREPVEKWESSGRLQQFYDNPGRRGFQFQIRAFNDRVREAQLKYREHKDNTNIFLLERSIFTDKLFTKLLFESGTIDQTEYEDYCDLWKMWEEVMPFSPDLFIYLKPSVEVCMSRLRKRNRDGEAGVTAAYQTGLEEKHDEFFGGDVVDIGDGRTVPRMLLQTDSNFRDDDAVRERICKLVEEEFEKLWK